MTTQPAIAIEHLRFGWPGSAAPCLELEQLRIDAGERVFLFGESGSGKSTLLGILGGVLVPQQGCVRVLGTELTALPAGARDRFRVDHIGFIFQQFNLIPYLSVLDNVLLPCRFSKRRQQRATAAGTSMQQEALRLLAELGIDAGLLARTVTALSVGQQQRVAVARALIGKPEIIVADEPTSALDAGRQADFLKLLLAECAASQATVLFVSHDERLATRFSREIPLAQINRARQVAVA